MRIAFISDIHGNAVALEAVLADISQRSIDRVYVLGDLCYRGPEPERSLSLVRSLDTQVIKGNADEWVVRGVREGEVKEQALAMMTAEREWTVSRLAQADIEYLRELPESLRLEVEGIVIQAYHAAPGSLFEILAPDTADAVLQERMMSAAEADIYIYAHIHKPFIRYIGGRVLINTGSVGLPFDGLTRASYALVEVDGAGSIRTSIERVPFDAEHVIQLYEAAGYPNTEMMSRVLRSARI